MPNTPRAQAERLLSALQECDDPVAVVEQFIVLLHMGKPQITDLELSEAQRLYEQARDATSENAHAYLTQFGIFIMRRWPRLIARAQGAVCDECVECNKRTVAALKLAEEQSTRIAELEKGAEAVWQEAIRIAQETQTQVAGGFYLRRAIVTALEAAGRSAVEVKDDE